MSVVPHDPSPPQRYWRSLEELADTPEIRQRIAQEFLGGEHAWTDAVSRRSFLKLMGASIALAGLASCTTRQPPEDIVPYVAQPENLIPGRSLIYASTMPWRGWGRGVLVEQHEGRPTKIEGNPQHPSSLGSTDAVTQASILELYDPDRSPSILHAGNESSWGAITAALRAQIARAGGAGKVRLRVLTGTVTSPALAAQLTALQQVFPALRWHQFEAVGSDHARAGLQLAFGRQLHPLYDFTKATRVVALDSDFLLDDPGSLRYARELAQQKRMAFKPLGPADSRAVAPPPAHLPDAESLRLYCIESSVTITGAKADHRLPLRSADVAAFARHLAGALAGHAEPHPWSRWTAAVADDLRSHPAKSLVLAGEYQPPEVHALAHLLNHQLGAVGQSVRYLAPVEAPGAGTLQELTAELRAGNVDILLILETNPAFTAPADLFFASVLEEFSRPARPDGSPQHVAVHLGLHNDETGYLCRWHVPASHYLEAWGDLRGHDGTASLQQPLILPLYASRSPIELLAEIGAIGLETATPPPELASLFDRYSSGQEIVRRHWTSQWKHANPGEQLRRWRQSLRDGVIADTAGETITVAPAAQLEAIATRLPTGTAGNTIEINLRPDPHLHDGRYANNGWLLELPRPLTRLTWDNAALIAPATATALKLAPADAPEQANGKLVQISVNGHDLHLPVWVQPGQPDNVLTLSLGWGRARGGALAGAGTNIYPVRTSPDPWSLRDAKLRAHVGATPLACTQLHQLMNGRDIVRARQVGEIPSHLGESETPTLDSRARDRDGKTVHLSVYPEYAYTGYKWAMVIDQTACIGCNACVVACQAENNIPIVGKDQVLRGRAMHWLRIDTYYGSTDTSTFTSAAQNPAVHFQPMLCQHCEKAPCELVCPVEATSHSAEGINEMTYNRCVGTRYCSNNCPYKVRRFNFFLWNDHEKDTFKMQRNPNVTVRSRGVMEKCTYCIQRINEARINGKKQWVINEQLGKSIPLRRPATEGGVQADALPVLEVLTACQAACPTEAIVFGDLNDADSHVARLKHQQPFASINYGVLVELNTQPRTSYLRRLTNPNPQLEAPA